MLDKDGARLPPGLAKSNISNLIQMPTACQALVLIRYRKGDGRRGLGHWRISAISAKLSTLPGVKRTASAFVDQLPFAQANLYSDRANIVKRALIVDDDQEIRQLLGSYLADFGIEACVVANGPEMREAMTDTVFDVIILDLMMPGEDGLSLCRQLRLATDIPIIILTARGEAADRVVGLELGADDYVIKPFDARELVARIHSLLRRAGTAIRHGVEAPPGDQISFEGWTLNRMTRQLVSPAQVVIPLSNAEFRLLWTFIENPRRVLTRDQLMDRVRGQLSSAFDRGIDLLVSRVRHKLQEDPKNPRLLKTIRGEGYWFEANIQR